MTTTRPPAVTPQPVFAMFTEHGVIAEDGTNFEFLGSAARYGFGDEMSYAVREAGSVTAPVRPAVHRGWPYKQEELVILGE